jgi:hypothetical protein
VSQIGSDLFVLSYTPQAIIPENRLIFGLRQPFMPLITGTVLLVRIKPFGDHRWIDVEREDIHRN